MHLLFKNLMKLNVGTCIPLFFTAVQIGVFAKEPVVEARREVTDESAPVLRVVVDDGFCPMSFYDADGNLSGLNVELITMVANQLGMRLEFESGDWLTCRQNLEEEKADVILGLETFSNMQHVLKTVPVTTDQLNIYGKNKIESIGALANKKVAVMARSVIMTIFDLQCEYVEYNTNSEILKAVENGEVDYGICHVAVAEKIIEKENLSVVPSLTIMNSFLTFGVREDEEELREAIEDGVQFMELLAPIGVENGQLKCSVMELGEADESGRRAPVDTGKVEYVPADTVIAAVGENIDGTLYEDMGVELDRKGRPVVDANMMTSVEGVYAAGDSRRGPATVVEAIADASKAAAAIAGISYEKYAEANVAEDSAKYIAKKGYQSPDLTEMPDKRCLGCSTVCETCADVCPNRANVAIKVAGKCQEQVIHVDGMCNECGNCAVFCPYAGRPYKDKFTLFWSEEDFTNSENEGFYCEENGEIHLRLDDKVEKTDINGIRTISADAAAVIETIQKDYSYLMK